MIRQAVNQVLRHMGYEIHKIPHIRTTNKSHRTTAYPPPIAPIWPLPRSAQGPSDEEIRASFARYDLWHYPYEFEGNLSFPARHIKSSMDDPNRPSQRFRHFMPYLIECYGGHLKGKRILDIACNSGFWSIQCALLGAEVVGFDARPELIEQANLIKRITGIDNVEFRVLDFWQMSPETLGGEFDAVLNLGILYHLPKPLEALERTRMMARTHILLDTQVYPSEAPAIVLLWEEPFDTVSANDSGVIGLPTKSGVELMLRQMKATRVIEIPIRSKDIPVDYLRGERASWLIEV